MKIVKRIEDIQGDMWCRATEVNFNSLIKLGFRSHTEWIYILTDHEFHESDIFVLQDDARYIKWCSCLAVTGEEISFDLNTSNSSLLELGFMEPETFKVEILKIYNDSKETEYIGTVNNSVPAKWNSEGICLNLSSEYNLYKEYKQKIYTKPNSIGFYPKQKFIISSTEKMSISLEKQGWRLATNEEIEGLKCLI